MSEIPYVVAIDASLTCTAICSGQHDADVVVDLVSVPPMPGGCRNRFIRYQCAVQRIVRAIPPCSLTVYIEGYAFMSKTSGVVLAEFGAVVRLAILNLPQVLDLHEIPPSSIKQYAAGKGNAKKPEMAEGVMNLWGREFSGDDAVDAYALWRLGRHHQGVSQESSEQQNRVIERLRAPKKSGRKR